MKTVVIVGGGAAGMMAGIALGEGGFEGRVILLERNKYLGAKVLISGGGRCNVTTGIFEVKKLLKNYPRGEKFLMSAMFRFPPEKVMEWFESHGVPLKIEEDLRVFPQSDNGKDVVGALEKTLRDQGVEIWLDAKLEKVTPEGQGFALSLQNQKTLMVPYVILACGGNAYRHTGSAGDGYAFAQALGHSITPLAPSLNSFILKEKPFPAGVSFQKIRLTLSSGNGTQYQRTGPGLFTHHGLSGPVVFALSSLAAHETFSQEKPLQLALNFFPDSSSEELENYLLSLIQKYGKKQLINFLDLFLPQSFCPIFSARLSLDPRLFASKISKEQRKQIVSALQNFTYAIIGRGAGDEFVTAGGVSLSEVNPNTMESKICSGLYFTGEILDIDGFTGGFNLQAAWATGSLAGESVAKTLKGLIP